MYGITIEVMSEATGFRLDQLAAVVSLEAWNTGRVV